MVTKAQVKSGIEMVRAVAEAIREVKEIPSGHLYARVMFWVSLEEYSRIIDILKRAEVIEETSAHLLKWRIA